MSAESTEEEHFDVIVYGTGVVASIVACALSKAGKKVCVFEKSSEYGGFRSTMHWNDFSSMADSHNHDSTSITSTSVTKAMTNTSITQSTKKRFDLYDTDNMRIIDSKLMIDSEASETLKSLSRHFNIEPHCKLLYSFGSMLDTLLHSGVYRYLEFCSLEATFFLPMNTSMESIARMPCTKGEVFQSTHFSVAEKRSLMKFLQFSSDWGRYRSSGNDNATLNESTTTAECALHRPQNKGDYQTHGYDVLSFLNQPFGIFLDHCKVPTNVKTVLAFSLALQLNLATSTEHALADLHLLLSSIGRYGSSAFLFPHYGLGALNQAFSRMSAVWGCTHMLRTPLISLTLPSSSSSSSSSSSIASSTQSTYLRVNTSDGRRFSCEHFICEANAWLDDTLWTQAIIESVSVLKQPLLPCITGSATLSLPPLTEALGNPSTIFIIQHGSQSLTVPDGYCNLHIRTIVPRSWQQEKQIELLRKVIRLLLDRASEGVQELAYISTLSPLYDAPGVDLPSNIHLCYEEDGSLHYESAVARANEIFRCICGDRTLFEVLPDDGEDEQEEELAQLGAALDTL